MFRRSRFSARPNVGAANRTAAASQETPAVSKDAGDSAKSISKSNSKVAVAQSEKSATQGDGNDPSGEANSSSAAVQRRKRFSVKPKVAPGRPSALARAQKSPVRAVSQSPVRAQHSTTSDKLMPASQTPVTEPSKGPLSPRKRRPSEEISQSKPQPKPSLVHSDCFEPPGVAFAEDLPNNGAEGTVGTHVKEQVKLPDKVPPSLPDKEAVAISERAKALVSSKMRLSASPAAYTLSRLLNDHSDLQRLAKAQKLRDLMKREVHKERKKRKANLRTKEFTLDPAKMTMRDLIHYLPESNPMTTSLEDPLTENEIVVSLSPERQDSPGRAQEPELPSKASTVCEEDEDEAAATEEEEQEEALLVPQVKVAEDGSLIIDEESLTVEVQRAKGPNPANEREPIFERGSTTTYSSFRKGTYSKPWSSEETDMFFLAISMVGTDFSMICQLFPHRARSEIKNKFKKEERENAWRIDKAFKDRQKLDIEYFSKLLEKILEVQKNRKKLKSLAEKNSPRKKRRKPKDKKAAKKLSDVEEEDEDDIPDLEGEEEGEKENEDLCNDGGTPGLESKRKRKRAYTNKKDCLPEDNEVALLDDSADSELAGPTENLNALEDAEVKPAKLSRGRPPRPVPQLGGRRSKKPQSSSKKPRDAASETWEEETAEEQVGEDVSPSRQDSKRTSDSEDVSSEEEGAAVLPPRPTRYGRMPKPTKPLTYLARDNSPSAPEATPASPLGSSPKSTKPKCTMKKRKLPSKSAAHGAKRSKLLTLLPSRINYSDDEETEGQWENEQQPECSFAQKSDAFVPASLRSPDKCGERSWLINEVEELDVLVHMPDVLGIAQDAVCPDATCTLANNETGLAEPCQHQLDLLVDVIDCLSSDYTITEDESYNEAAHTLLTIGNVTQFPENEAVAQGHSTDSSAAVDAHEKSNDDDDMPVKAEPAASLSNPEQTKQMPPLTRKGCTSKVRPAPNLGQASISKTAGCPARSGSGEQATGKSTENHLESISSPPVQQSGEDPAAVAAPVKDSPVSEEEPGTSEGVSSRLSRRGAKPQPNLTKATRSACSQNQATEVSLDSSSSPSLAPDLSVLPIESSAAMSDESRTHQIALETPLQLTDSTQLTPEPSQTSEVIEETAAPHPRGVETSSRADSDKDLASADLHVSWEEYLPRPPVKSRFQKIKPTPNLTHAVRNTSSRPQVSKTPEEKVPSPAPGSESHKGPKEDVAGKLTEKKLNTTLPPVVNSLLDLKSMEGLSTTMKKEGDETIDSLLEAELDPGLAPVEEQHVTQKGPSQLPAKSRFHKLKPKPSLALASRSVRPNPKVDSCNVTQNPEVHPVEPEAKQALIASPEKSSASDLKQSCDAPPPPPNKEDLKEMDVGTLGQVELSAAAADQSIIQEQAVATDFAPSEESGSQEKGGEMSSVCQTRRREKVKPKPRLTGRSVASKTAALKVPLTGQRIAEQAAQTELLPPSPQNQIELAATASLPEVEQKLQESSTGGQIIDVESNQGSMSEGFGRNLPLRRHFSKINPNIGLCATQRLAGQQPEVSEVPLAGEHRQQVVPVSSSSQKSEGVGAVVLLESETCLGQKSSESKIKLDATQLSESGQLSCAKSIQSLDVVQQPSESSIPASQSANKLEPLKSSGKVPQASRGRLVKPKPNVTLRRRAQQQKELQPKEVVEAPADRGQAFKGHTSTQKSEGGEIEQPPPRESPNVVEQPSQDISASPVGSFTQNDLSSLLSEDQMSSAVGRSQSCSGLKLFSDMLPEQVPSDPNESFFILSLTEVPLGEFPVGGASEMLSSSPPGPSGSSTLQHVSSVSEAPQVSAVATQDTASENPAESQAKENKQNPSGNKQIRRSRGAAKSPAEAKTSTDKQGCRKTLVEPGSLEQTAFKSRDTKGASKDKAKTTVSHRKKKDAASTSELVAASPSVETLPFKAPTANSTGPRCSAEETDTAASAPENTSAGPASTEQGWCTDELLDWQPTESQESSCRSDDELTGVSQYFLSDIFTEVKHE